MATPQPASNLFTQVDITPSSPLDRRTPGTEPSDQHSALLRQIVAAQDRQNELLEELVSLLGAAQRQRQGELTQWKQANPELARHCRRAAETLSKVQVEFLKRLTDEVADSADVLLDGEFMLTEFVDRFGPRLAHLNGVLQVLSQLGVVPNSQKQL